MSPTNPVAIPAKLTVAEAVPMVAVVVRASLESGVDGAAAPVGIGLFSGPLPVRYAVT
jgi:hypothetical protein